jgi:ABC-type multidrug transport system fused ATPase/permease subunit
MPPERRDETSGSAGGERQHISIARALLKDAPILLPDDGRLTEEGRSDELIQRDGLFARLYRIQRESLGLERRENPHPILSHPARGGRT